MHSQVYVFGTRGSFQYGFASQLQRAQLIGCLFMPKTFIPTNNSSYRDRDK